ncbi:hypothetical protein AALP_AA6G106900 [Arabis alpina]|uniref:beta-ketoacyl-[acyl-carrier-protein] synthase I n=1 Tax=Arabis alpina TaxID=50452 RepID=A0A087GNE7_ARAAL|nr:hypothetical protein AALP_AA6G106900 [Arabis alpina]
MIKERADSLFMVLIKRVIGVFDVLVLVYGIDNSCCNTSTCSIPELLVIDLVTFVRLNRDVLLLPRLAGEIKSYSVEGRVAPKLSKRMDKFMIYLLTACKKALADGGVIDEVMAEFDKTKCGVLIGSAMGGMKDSKP